MGALVGLVVASEALAKGQVTRWQLQQQYVKLYRNVYVLKGLELDAFLRARAAWLWSGRTAVIVGSSAAAVLGSRWIPSDTPAELGRVRSRAPSGIEVHSGALAPDEIRRVGDMLCTTPARTAYDLGRRVRPDTNIIRIDALLNATGCKVEDVEQIATRYPGARGIRRLRGALDLADGGAESPKETELRLLLVRAGLPRPVTQIRVGRRRVDMGYPEWKVGVEYDGEQHWSSPKEYADDIERLEFLASQGWIIVRVSARQLRYERDEIVRRVRAALLQAGAAA